ncbi:MAG: ABC transporter ATP-binding protein [Streptococcaceae bacterium]|jgi:putative ABC transport system ATP-binding protein|nr:ABC transporter ATP-binding protein [Streptococcaceae bacterium]
MSLLKVEHVQKVYQTKFKKAAVAALKDVNFAVERGEFIAIMGESGSGKSTLLNTIATLDMPTKGFISINGEKTDSIKEKDLAKFCREKLGFIFQDFNLLDTFSVKDNIYLPLVLSRDTENKKKRLSLIAKALGIEDLLEKYPYELSGGQKQRVAVARALITRPEILLGDEPTGALDSKNSEELLRLLEGFNKQGQTILMVTHSSLAASCSSRVLFIRDGRIFHQLYKGVQSNQKFLSTISDTMTNLFSRGEG